MAENFRKADDSLAPKSEKSVIFTFHVLALVKANGNETPILIKMHEAPLLYKRMRNAHHEIVLRAEWPETLRKNRICELSAEDIKAEIERLKEKYNYIDGETTVAVWDHVYGGEHSDSFHRALEKIAETYNALVQSSEVITDADVTQLMLSLVPSESHLGKVRAIKPVHAIGDAPSETIEAPEGLLLEQKPKRGRKPAPATAQQAVVPAEDADDLDEDAGTDMAVVERLGRIFANPETCSGLAKLVSQVSSADQVTAEQLAAIETIGTDAKRQSRARAALATVIAEMTASV